MINSIWIFCREVARTAGVSTTDLVGRMLLMTRAHFGQGDKEYYVEKERSTTMGLDSQARSPYTGCSQFLPTTQKIIQFSEGKEPKVCFIVASNCNLKSKHEIVLRVVIMPM